MNGWKPLLALLGTALGTALATHFGGAALQVPQVTGEECAKILMQMAVACEGCP